MSLRPGFLTAAQPGLVIVRVFITGGQVSFRAIKDVADGVVSPEQAPLTDLRFAVGDPVADFEFPHLAFATGQIKLEGTGKRVRCLLVVVEHEVTTNGRDPSGKLNIQSPSRHVHLMDTLVAQVTVAGIPDPMPVVMKPVAGERL